MTVIDKVWLGADPGGNGNFGIAILQSDGTASTYCVGCADEAVQTLVRHLQLNPAGVGVDAPLWWSSGHSSDRRADRWLRTRYHLPGGRVQAANSLRGAALVQGVMFVYRARQRFPEVNVTETHPKALLTALGLNDWNSFCSRFSVMAEIENVHERDAVISAVAAREGFERRWLNDLSVSRDESEQDPSGYWLAPIHYFWPEK